MGHSAPNGPTLPDSPGTGTDSPDACRAKMRVQHLGQVISRLDTSRSTNVHKAALSDRTRAALGVARFATSIEPDDAKHVWQKKNSNKADHYTRPATVDDSMGFHTPSPSTFITMLLQSGFRVFK